MAIRLYVRGIKTSQEKDFKEYFEENRVEEKKVKSVLKQVEKRREGCQIYLKTFEKQVLGVW